VQSGARPAAAALAEFVSAASAAFASGHAPDALCLYLEELTRPPDARAGPRLTAGEAEYRTQWLWVVHETLRRRGSPSRHAFSADAAPPLIADQVAAVLAAAAAGTPGAGALDAALATRAAREDPSAPRATLAAHWMPVKQLVLLTCAIAAEQCEIADEEA
jgi:hypothetical protein